MFPLLRTFYHQDYPRELLFLIILDDSPSPTETQNALETCLRNYPDELKSRITYLHHPYRLTIGQKRNRLNDLALLHQQGGKTRYVACMDDDDYYFPCRISYSVEQLRRAAGSALIAGCNQALVYFPLAFALELSSRDQLSRRDQKFRVYAREKLFRSPTVGSFISSPGNICNGSMVYHVDYLKTHRYLDGSKAGEEKAFLNNFEEAVLHLPSERIFICVAHGTNTVEKYSMVRNFGPTMIDASTLIEDEDCLTFYRGGKKTPQSLENDYYYYYGHSPHPTSQLYSPAGVVSNISTIKIQGRGGTIFPSVFPSMSNSGSSSSSSSNSYL